MIRRSGVFLVAGRLAAVSLRRYVGGGALFVLFSVVPILTGLVLKELFDQLSGERAATLDAALWLCAAIVAVEVVRGGLFWLGLSIWIYWWNGGVTTLRANVLPAHRRMVSRGPPTCAGAGP